MPWKTTLKNAEKDRREGKAPTTQAGEFVKEEMEHVKRGKHGVKSRKQAIAIGLSKARRAGVKLPARKGSRSSSASRSTKGRSSAARGGTRKAGARKTGARKTSGARRSSGARSRSRSRGRRS